MVKTSKTDEEPLVLLTPPKAGEELFEGKGQALKVTKDVHPLQLIDEVYDRLGSRDKYQVVTHLEDDETPVSEGNPLTLHLLGDIDLKAVEAVVETHVKDAEYGLAEGEKELKVLAARLTAGEDLPVADLNKLLRGVLQG
jgi:hypothetical protein